MPSTIRLHRVLRAPAERVYRAFLDPDAMCKWLPPNGFTTGTTHSFGGEYLELVEYERIRYVDRFEDPNLPGDMQVTVSLATLACGTELNVVQDGIPDAIPVEACYLGWQESLILLGKLVEADIPDE